MKVKELIIELQKLDQETRIMTPGYDGGYDDFEPSTKIPKKKKIKLNQNTAWYYGQHDDGTDEDFDIEAYIL